MKLGRTACIAAGVVAVPGAVASGQLHYYLTNRYDVDLVDRFLSDDGGVVAYRYSDSYHFIEYAVLRETETDQTFHWWAHDDPERPAQPVGLSGDGLTLLNQINFAGDLNVWHDGSHYVPQPLPGATSCEVTSMTSGTEIVGVCTMPDASTHPVIWTAPTPTALGVEGDVRFVSRQGLVIVGQTSDGWVYRWENGTAELIVEGEPLAINTDGSVIAGESSSGDNFRWRDGVFDYPPRWGWPGAHIEQVSDDGEVVRLGEVVVGGPGPGDILHVDGVYWMSNDGSILLGDDGAPFVRRGNINEYLVSPAASLGGTLEVRGVSDDGTVVVGQFDVQDPNYISPVRLGSIPFIWTPEWGLESVCDYLGYYGIEPYDCLGAADDRGRYIMEGVSRNGRTVLGTYFDFRGPTVGMFYFMIPQACSVADLTTQGAGPSNPLFGRPDEAVTAADLAYYVNDWVAREPGADVTTSNAPVGDPLYGEPDGLVTAADIQYYVNVWVVGCP